MEKQIADHKSENGVAEKFEGLVVADIVLARLMGVRLVRECTREQVAAMKLIPDALFECGEVALHLGKSIGEAVILSRADGEGSRQVRSFASLRMTNYGNAASAWRAAAISAA